MPGDQDTDHLFRCLRQVGANPPAGTALAETVLDTSDIKMMIRNRVPGSVSAARTPPQGVKLGKDTGRPVHKKTIAYMPAPKPRKTSGFMPMLKKAVASIEAGIITHDHKLVNTHHGPDLQKLTLSNTPLESYKRRRAKLTSSLDIGLDGLERQFGIFDRKCRAMFFAQLLEIRQFDNFANPQIWFAAKMEKRLGFMNDVLNVHSRLYQLNPARVDAHFTGELPTMPDSAIGNGNLSAYDPEQQKILINPPFWHNAVTFEAIIGTVIEQNCRNHARQLCQLYDRGQMRADDPRIGQAALFSIQWRTFDQARQEMKDEAERKQLTTSWFTGTGDIAEIGFDEYAQLSGEAIRLKLIDLLSGSAPQVTGRQARF